MPDTAMTRRPLALAALECEQSGETLDTAAYRSGWRACMDWDALDPPASLSPAEADLWRAGWQDAFDAPLGSACP
jgi:hypothetical protein